MSKPIDEQISELEQAIRIQDGLRDSVGDDVVDAAVEALRDKLNALKSSSGEERKLVTCLFCDLVGSTRMAAERDPEDVLKVVDGALREMSTAVHAYGGNIARYMGDGVLAFFGAPQALEDHAEQAILAGLDIQSRMSEYAVEIRDSYGLDEFQARVGINSGYVVAGHVAGAKGEYTVIGDTVNLASRIEEAAPPGGVLVGESTFRLAGSDAHFDARSLGKISMKGQVEPLEVFEVRGPIESYSHKTMAVARAPLTGRLGELSQLQQQFQSAVEEGMPKAVAIIGEAGIGKTRLRQEFTAWLVETNPSAFIWLGRAFSYSNQTPFGLVGSLLKSALEINQTDEASQMREKLEKGWSAANGLTMEHLHGLAAILALEYPDDLLSNLEPRARRNAIFNAFSAFAAGYAQQAHLVLVLEDIQWSDDASLDLMEYLIQSASNAPLFGLLLSRPPESTAEDRPTAASRIAVGPYSEIRLQHLTAEQTSEMIQSLLSTSSIPLSMVDSIVEATQGNPFFIEEIISSLIEDGTLKAENGTWILTSKESDLHVPETVQGVLAARIDRLEPELKDVLQHAAIIGRTFWQELLANLMQQSVDNHLNKLSEQDFVQRRGRDTVVQDWEWIFRHVLVQDVAYDSVLKQLRRTVHLEIAKWLETQGADRLEELAPILALHYEEGKTWEKAIEFLLRAAERSRGFYALTEAGSFLDRAADLETRQLKGKAPELQLRIHEMRGDVRSIEGEFEGAVDDLSLVLAAARKDGDIAKEQRMLVSMGMVYRRADDYENAMSHLSKALDVARNADDRRGMADALYHLGSVAWSEGDNFQSTEYHQEALEICQELGLTDLIAVQAYHGRAEAYWLSGLPQQAYGMFDESLKLARQISDKSYEAENHQMLGLMCTGVFGIANYVKGKEHGVKSLEISEEAHLHWHTVPSLYTMALISMGSGEYQRAHEYVVRAKVQAEELGAVRLLAIGLGFEAMLYEELDLLQRAEATNSEGVEISLMNGTDYFLVPLRAGLAIDRLRQGDLQVGEQLKRALAESKARDQMVFATRCLQGLVELALVRGEPQAAMDFAEELFNIAEAGGLREVLAKVYCWRGQAQLAKGELEAAEQNLLAAQDLAQDIGAPRLLWDVHAALANHYAALSNAEMQAIHSTIVRELVDRISADLTDPELRLGLPTA
jgi:class 3 adenylate cyclase/tetratricopeptide (TPR) repeat protein